MPEYSTHKAEFCRVFCRLDGKVYRQDWNNLVSSLFIQYQPLRIKIAKRASSLCFDIAMTACIKGFMDGIKKYADDKMYLGEIHFAKHIGFYMRSECQKEYRNAPIIHIPHNYYTLLSKAKKLRIFERDDLTPEEMEMKRELEDDILPLLNTTPIDSPIVLGNGNNTTLEEIVPDPNAENALNKILENDRVKLVHKYINQLDERERFCLINYEGLYGKKKKTLRELGEELLLSHTAVDNIITRAKINLNNIIIDNVQVSQYDLR